MVLTSVLSLVLSFSTVLESPTNTYDYKSQVQSVNTAQTLLFETSTNHVNMAETEVTTNFTVDFQDEYSYRLSNFRYNVTVNYYNYDSNQYILEKTLSYNVVKDWELTAENNQTQWSKINFEVGIDSDDMLYIAEYYETTYQNKVEYEVEDSITTRNSLKISFFGGMLLQKVTDFISNYNSKEVYQEGYNDGRISGYSEGYNAALDQESTAATIFTGIVTVGLLPVNIFLGILNFEVFGINIGAFVSALLTVAIVIIIIKMFTGSQGGGKSD